MIHPCPRLSGLSFALLLMLGACAQTGDGVGGAAAPSSSGSSSGAVPVAAPRGLPPLKPAPRTGAFGPQYARSASALDRASEGERAAALARPAAGAELGRVVVSLGSPTEAGFWLRTALVKTDRPGTVRLAGGRTVNVDLRPPAGSGGGAQLSLSAYRALGLGLTDLPEVTVLGR